MHPETLGERLRLENMDTRYFDALLAARFCFDGCTTRA
jgi:hypothetical protein